MRNRIIPFILLVTLVASVASGQLAVYIDDDGPATDTILAIATINEAVQINPAVIDDLPDGDFALLLSEYDEPSETMLFISNGAVWISSERTTRLNTAIRASLASQGISATETNGFPDDLREEINERTNRSEAEPTCTAEDETRTLCPDGSIEEDCRCIDGALVCEYTMCPEPAPTPPALGDPSDEESDDQEPEAERRGIIAWITDFLYGWLRR